DLHSADGTLAARPLQPLAFSGDLPIESRMVAGPIRDLNLIYDASRIEGAVTVLQGPALFAPPPDLAGLLCLSGGVAIAGTPLAQGAFALGQLGQITLGTGAAAILVTLADRQAEPSNPATA
ncbi:MAG: HutD family protein, partial [Paracoccaceae bacterium]